MKKITPLTLKQAKVFNSLPLTTDESAMSKKRRLQPRLRKLGLVFLVTSSTLSFFVVNPLSTVLRSIFLHQNYLTLDFIGQKTSACEEKKCVRFDIIEDVDTSESSCESRYYKEALGYFNQTLVGTRSTWAHEVLHMNKTCPIILSGRHQKSGLGHAFMSFNTLVAIANFYKLTLNATFPEKLSHSPDLAQVAKFFTGEVFRPRFDNCSCQHHFQADANSLAETVSMAKSICTAENPICINITREMPPAEVLVDVPSYRKNFAVPESITATLQALPFFNESYLRVAIHLRRGDVVNRTRYANR